MVLADKSGRRFSCSCQAAISFHMTPPCYRSSCIIGAVFGEITLPTLPIIYHMEENTAPVILLFGTVQLTAFTLCYEALALVLPDAFLPVNPSITTYWSVPDSHRGFAP